MENPHCKPKKTAKKQKLLIILFLLSLVIALYAIFNSL